MHCLAVEEDVRSEREMSPDGIEKKCGPGENGIFSWVKFKISKSKETKIILKKRMDQYFLLFFYDFSVKKEIRNSLI